MKNLFCYIFIHAFILLNAQQITGYISDVDGKPLSANVLLKKADKVVAFSISDNEGIFIIRLNQTIAQETLTIEVKKQGYFTEEQIFTLNGNEDVTINFVLEKSTVALAPIHVKAKATPIRVKSDTVTYNADSFRDGSEKVVEDLLKNLPGVEVEGTGRIKYKGKEISKLLLDGDDLFDKNYVAGSRNITVDIIDKVEAIENFSENYLLKGIENSKKVALNLKLKKGMADWSGNANLGYGIADRYDADVNLIGVTASDKNFSTLSYNNVGKNNTPKNYFGQQLSIEESAISNYLSNKLVPETSYYSPLGENRANRNDLFFGNINHIHKFSDKLSARVNLNFIKDALQFNQNSTTAYFLPNQERFSLFTHENATKKPTYQNGNAQLVWKTSPESMLEYQLKWYDEKIKTPFALTSNQSTNLEVELASNSYFLMNHLQYTWRLYDTKALLLETAISSNAIPQVYTINTAYDISQGIFIPEENSIQWSRTIRKVKEASATLMGSGKETDNKYFLKLGGKMEEQGLKSHWQAKQDELFINDIMLEQSNLYLESEYKLKLGKFAITPNLRADYNHFKISGSQDSTISKFVLNPKVSIIRPLTQYTNLMMNYSYQEKANDIYEVFDTYILRGFRTIERNEPKLVYQKSFMATTAWIYNDQYNLFRTSVMFNYYNTKNNFFTRNIIQPDFTLIDRFILSESNSGIHVQYNIQKYISWLSSTIKFKTRYNRAQYKNIVNDSGLRDNLSHLVNAELFYKTAFDIPVNFQNIFTYQYMENQIKGSDFSQSFSSLNNDFIVFFKPNIDWFSSLTLAYFQPDLSKNNPYYFLDFDLSYQPQNASWEITLTGKNLLGNKNYQTYNITDFSKDTHSQSLNERYCLLTYSFKF